MNSLQDTVQRYNYGKTIEIVLRFIVLLRSLFNENTHAVLLNNCAKIYIVVFLPSYCEILIIMLSRLLHGRRFNRQKRES